MNLYDRYHFEMEMYAELLELAGLQKPPRKHTQAKGRVSTAEIDAALAHLSKGKS